MAGWWGCIRLCVGLCLSITGMTWAQRVVDGFEGGEVVLPCTISIRGDLRWRVGETFLLIRPSSGSAIPPEYSPWRNVINLVGSSNNLRISSLSRQRDDGFTFMCEGSQSGDGEETTLRVLARISGASIEQASEGQITVAEGTTETLTCAVTGSPNPSPLYRWTVDNGGITGQKSNYSLTASRSMKSVRCTATNTYSNGSVLSTAEATATLNVVYLDISIASSPIMVTENEVATLRCSAQGNPPPTFEWRRSESSEVKSTSADYRIENVQKSDAGEYTCDVTNSVGSRQTTVRLVVQLTYDQSTNTLSCKAEGVPDLHTFSPWEHRLGGTLIRRLGTQTNGTSVTHTLPDTLTYTDTVDYVCSATNGVRSPQSALQYVAPLTPAVFQDHLRKVPITLGKSETLSLSFYARSSTGRVRVRWEKAGESGLLQSHQEEPGMVCLEVYGQQVSLPGTITVLTLTDARQRDEGNYSLTVTTDINGVTRTSSASFYVEITDKGTTEKDISVQCKEASTRAIVGGLFGGLPAGVIVTLLVWMIVRRSRRKDLPEGADNRQMSPGGELAREMADLPRIADAPVDPTVNTDHSYESLAHNNTRSQRSRDQHYESLPGPGSGRDNTYENTNGAEASARTRENGDRANYENV